MEKNPPQIIIKPLGDSALSISFKIPRPIRPAIHSLEHHPLPGVIEWVPAFTTLSLYYRPEIVSFEELKDQLEKILVGEGEEDLPLPSPFIFEIPVCYGGDMGPDLAFVAQYHHRSEEEIIALHSAQEYLISMIGFMPGFPYLTGLPLEVATPRLEKPRPRVEAGSVGIAGNQTGIYPLASPGGWRIIGRTPVRPFDPGRDPAILFSTGHFIRFTPVSREAFQEIQKEVDQGIYRVKRL